MELGSFRAMVKDYERRTGETVDLAGFRFFPDGSCHNEYNEYLHYQPGDGFIFWSIVEKKGVRYFSINQTYGVFRKLCPYIESIMKANDLFYIITSTTRPKGVHERRWGMKPMPEYDYVYEGRNYRVLISDINHLR